MTEGNKNKIMFSIIVPAYKKRFLFECIESILNQSCNDFELIIVDDCSPENLADVISKFSDDRIRFYVNEKNYGAYNLVDNWNHCLSYCSGDYVMCMGDDDRLLPECLELYKKAIDKYPGANVYHMHSQMIDENGNIHNVQEGRPESESVYSFIWHEIKDLRRQFIGDFLFDTVHLKEIGGFYNLPYAWHSDRISVAAAAENTEIINIPEFGFQYRESPFSITDSRASRESALGKAEAWQLSLKWYNDFLEDTSGLNKEDQLYCRLIKEILPGFIQGRTDNEVRLAVNSRRSDFFFWFKQRKKYNLNIRRILFWCIKDIFR